MSKTPIAARLEGLIEKHVDAILELAAAVQDPQLDPLEACRQADAMAYVLRSSTTMLEELQLQLSRQLKQIAGRAN